MLWLEVIRCNVYDPDDMDCSMPILVGYVKESDANHANTDVIDA